MRITGHGIDVEALLAAGRRYFQLPLSSRHSVRNASTGFQRGYIPFAGEAGLADFLEVKEGFCYGHAWPNNVPPQGANVLEGSNVWPPEADAEDSVLGPKWRRLMEDFYEGAVAISKAAVLSIANVVPHEGDPLEKLVEGGERISQMRFFHYWPKDYRPDVAQGKPRLGSSPHTDWHLVTVVLRDNRSKLEYRPPVGDWKEADFANDNQELLLIFGDYLSAYLGGKTHSPVHRVLLPSRVDGSDARSPEDRSSLSFVLFFCPGYAAPMPRQSVDSQRKKPGEKYNTLMDEVNPSLNDVTFGEHLQVKWRRVLGNANPSPAASNSQG